MHTNKTFFFFFWSRWKQKYWLALRVFTSMQHLVMKCMTVGPDKGEKEGREPRASVFVLKSSLCEVPTGGPHASGYRPTCSVLRRNPHQDKWSVWSLGGKKNKKTTTKNPKSIQPLKVPGAALQEPSSNFSSKASFTGLDIHICRTLKHKLVPLKIKSSRLSAGNSLLLSQ